MNFDNLKNQSVAVSIALIIIGLIFLIWPGATITTIMGILGWVILICGILALVMSIRHEEKKNNLVGSVAAIIVGALFIAHPGFLVSLFPIIVGLIILIDAVYRALPTWRQKDALGDQFAYQFAGEVIEGILGLLIIIFSFTLMKVMVVLLGITLVYAGVVGIILHRAD